MKGVRSKVRMLLCCLSLAMVQSMPGQGVGQENADSAGNESDAVKDVLIKRPPEARVSVPVVDPQEVPAKEDWGNEQRLRDQKTLFVTPGQSPANERPARKQYQLLLQQEQRKQMELQRARLESELGRIHAELERLQFQPTATDADRARLKQQLDMTRLGLAQIMVSQEEANAAAPVLEDAVPIAFQLKQIRAKEVADILHRIYGDAAMRVAVDEPRNILLVLGNEKTAKSVHNLLETLDKSTAGAGERPAAETLQLRIIWLLDGLPEGEGSVPSNNLVSPEVVDALGQLGFENPKVVCQQVTTLTLGQENRRGQFHFEIPVLINSQAWQFEGAGLITPMSDERFALQFNLNFQQVNNPQRGQLGGSIYTPLGHYTVMGTTTFVAATFVPAAASAEGEVALPQQQQHLSAFVVYLDCARRFPAGNAASDAKTPAKRDDPFAG